MLFGGGDDYSYFMLVVVFNGDGIGSVLFFDGAHFLFLLEVKFLEDGGYFVLVVVWILDLDEDDLFKMDDNFMVVN